MAKIDATHEALAEAIKPLLSFADRRGLMPSTLLQALTKAAADTELEEHGLDVLKAYLRGQDLDDASRRA